MCCRNLWGEGGRLKAWVDSYLPVGTLGNLLMLAHKERSKNKRSKPKTNPQHSNSLTRKAFGHCCMVTLFCHFLFASTNLQYYLVCWKGIANGRTYEFLLAFSKSCCWTPGVFGGSPTTIISSNFKPCHYQDVLDSNPNSRFVNYSAAIWQFWVCSKLG